MQSIAERTGGLTSRNEGREKEKKNDEFHKLGVYFAASLKSMPSPQRPYELVEHRRHYDERALPVMSEDIDDFQSIEEREAREVDILITRKGPPNDRWSVVRFTALSEDGRLPLEDLRQNCRVDFVGWDGRSGDVADKDEVDYVFTNLMDMKVRDADNELDFSGS